MLSIPSPTPEGCLIDEVPSSEDGYKTVREVGKLGYVIWEYRVKELSKGDTTFVEVNADAASLLRRIAELGSICARLRDDNPVSIDLAQYKWNLKRAKRRFRRWYQENDPLNLDVPADLRELANAILSSAADQENELMEGLDLVSHAYTTGDICVLEEYVRRKLDRPPLILSRIPNDIASLLTEANEAYRLGTFRGVAALCRATLEKTIRTILDIGLDEDVAVPAKPNDLKAVINCIPDRLLNKSGRDFAHEVRRRANGVLHRGADLSEDYAWYLLVLTTRVVQALLDRSRSLNGT